MRKHHREVVALNSGVAALSKTHGHLQDYRLRQVARAQQPQEITVDVSLIITTFAQTRQCLEAFVTVSNFQTQATQQPLLVT